MRTIASRFKKFNSGLGFRLTGKNGKPKGYQFEIDRYKPGAVYGIGLGGWLYPKKEQEKEYTASLAEFDQANAEALKEIEDEQAEAKKDAKNIADEKA